MNKTTSKPAHTKQDFPVIGIGASAGGLDAFKRFIKAIPLDSGMAYVIVQHLAPLHESMLTEILGHTTKIPTHTITNNINLAPDNIYVIPENKMLTTSDGVLKLEERNGAKINRAVDIFFTSLAKVHKRLSVGVVLSGMGTDGTLGLKSIKDFGGLTFAQDNYTADYKSMPQSAINADTVDFILSPEKIPKKLIDIFGK
ncbi:MAG: chemotaxis protein CheB [Bacteroidetes bacterium]|nr:chemotaxis protein CheB [Bacteroidota bacterium]